MPKHQDELSYRIVDDSERRDYTRPRRDAEWDKIAELLKEGKTLFIERNYRQAIDICLKRRGIRVSMSKREGGFIVWAQERDI